MNTMIKFLFLIISLNFFYGQSKEICLSLSRGSEMAHQPTTELRDIPTRDGAPGLKGQKGDTGDPGLTATCTCDTEEIKKFMSRSSCIAGMIWNKTCVYLPYASEERVNYYEAVRVCNSSGGELLKITDEKMYDVVYDYLNRTWVGYEIPYLNRYWFWLGMTFQPVNNPDHLITITPEWKITLNRWYPHSPTTGKFHPTFVNIYMQVYLGGGRTDKGLSNADPSYTLMPLCQYQL